MRILGIDFGESRIGISMSDPLGIIAQGCETIDWSHKGEIPYSIIIDIVKKNIIEKIVIGFPLNMNGTVGFRGERTLEFIDGLKEWLAQESLTVDIVKWDERLSTKSAQRTMREMGLKARNNKGIVDKIASVHILQNYLDTNY